MNKGAILIGDNVLDGERLSATPIGDWDGFENIYNPQLHPYASSDSFEVGLEIESIPLQGTAYNAIALVGTNIGQDRAFGLLMTVDRWTGAGWVPVDAHTTYQIESSNSPRCVIIVIPQFEYHELKKIRLQWRPHTTQPSTVGHVIVGRAIQGIDLADEGWSVRYVDHSESVRSEGGQIFTDTGAQLVRELTVTSASMSLTTAFGAPEVVREIPLPHHPVLVGDVYFDSQSGGYSVHRGSAGDITFTGVLTPGKHYRIDYLDRMSNLIGNDFAPTSWMPPFTHFGTAGSGLISVLGQAESADLQFSRPTRNFKSKILKIRLYEVKPLPNGYGYLPEQMSFYNMAARHGRTRPVVFLPRPSDPVMGRVTGIYGYIPDPVKITHVGGNRFRTGFTIREAR